MVKQKYFFVYSMCEDRCRQLKVLCEPHMDASKCCGSVIFGQVEARRNRTRENGIRVYLRTRRFAKYTLSDVHFDYRLGICHGKI